MLEPTVFIVDHDMETQRALRRLLESVRLHVETCATTQEFADHHDPSRPGCLILEVRMRGMSGLELFRRLRKEGSQIPVIFYTEHGDVPMAVQVMREGAFHFLEKSCSEQYLLDQTHAAIAWDLRRRRDECERLAASARFDELSTREREVLTEIIAGKTNKQMAYQFGIAVKTVEFHRANIMRKVGAESMVRLVYLLSKSGWEAEGKG
jgi:FixJ family two-component response regulator